MNAYISNDGNPSSKVSFLSKKSSYRFFLYSLSLCFTAMSFLHSSTAYAVNGRVEIPNTLQKGKSPELPKDLSAVNTPAIQTTEAVIKSFNGNLNHCDPRSIRSVSTFSDLKSTEEIFLDKFTGLSSYQVFQIEDPSSVDEKKLYTTVVNGWVIDVQYVDPKTITPDTIDKDTINFVHFQGPPKANKSAPISCYYHMVGNEMVIESEYKSQNVGLTNLVVRSNNKYLTMYQNRSITADRVLQTVYSSYKKVDGKPDQLFRQEIWSTSNQNVEVMNSAQVFFMNSKPSGRPSLIQIRAFDRNQTARATGSNEVTVELVNQNKVPMTFYSNGKIIRIPESTFFEKIKPSQLLKSNSEENSAPGTYKFGLCLLEIDKKSQGFIIVTNLSPNSDGEPAPVKVNAHVMLSLPDALTAAKCY